MISDRTMQAFPDVENRIRLFVCDRTKLIWLKRSPRNSIC
ncbi:hypothetical protein APA_2788 [Pseudanabaena sp. lw0831]|nr:hypothetical protein APA_2788 [Pseudanabaena sp. lw0831]